MLHYPHLNIPEEKFAWIYPLSTQLEPSAELYLWEDHRKDIKATWAARLKAKEYQTYGEAPELIALCSPLLREYPRIHCFFTFLMDAYIMQGQLDHAAISVEKRIQWMAENPYKIIGQAALEIGFPVINRTLPNGYTYKLDMTDWIGAMRTLQFYRIDIQHKKDTGFKFKARPRPKNRRLTP